MKLLATLLVAGALTLSALPAAAAASAKPARTVTVDGVPLAPISRSERAQCRHYADRMRRPTICPGILPVPIAVSATAPYGTCTYSQPSENACGPAYFETTPPELFVNQANFEVPASYLGVPGLTSATGGPLGHFVFVEAPKVQFVEGAGPHPKVVSVPGTCHPVAGRNRFGVHGTQATLYDCADGPMTPTTPALYLGHTLLTWRQRGLEVQVSFHGHSQTNVDLDLAVARDTVVVTPRKP